jgi:hypothetical protein
MAAVSPLAPSILPVGQLQHARASARRTGVRRGSTGFAHTGRDMTLLRTILDRLGFDRFGGPPLVFA